MPETEGLHNELCTTEQENKNLEGQIFSWREKKGLKRSEINVVCCVGRVERYKSKYKKVGVLPIRIATIV